MKKHSILLGLALGLISFCSCSKINDALTVKVPVDFTTDMQVMDSTAGLKTSSKTYWFYASATINPSTNATLAQYKSKIKSITASGISFTPTGLSGDITVKNAELFISNASLTHIDGLSVRWRFSSLTLKNGVKIDLPKPTDPFTGIIEGISTMLDDDQDIFIGWKGTQSTPVNTYTFSTTMKAEVTAYLLKQ